MAEAFRTFAIEPPYQVRSLRKMLIERIKELSDQLAYGSAKDWPDYKERIGEIAGLNQAVEYCNELEKLESQ